MLAKFLILLMLPLFSSQVQAKQCSELLDHDVRTLNGKTIVNLCEKYQGKVLLVVNTASRCAYTDQYDGLEKLYKEYKDNDLVVLGFPSNDFGHQEPGTEKEIKSFCRLTYGVQFPMFAKMRVTERSADPFYAGLARASGTYPKWNFHKYLIDREGNLVANYQSAIEPYDDQIIDEIKNQLMKKNRF